MSIANQLNSMITYLEDAYREYRLSYGRSRRSSIEITSVYLV